MAIDEMPEPVWEAFSEQFAITFLRDGRDVKPLLQQRSFDILFLDLFLSGEDGLQLLRDIHTTGRSVASEVPLDGNGVFPAVILTSAAPNFSFAREGLLYGACDYLLHPFERQTLAECLERVCRRQDSQSPAERLLTELLATMMPCMGTDAFPGRLAQCMEQILACAPTPIQADHQCRVFFRMLVKETFARYGWLSNFLTWSECEGIAEIRDNDIHLVQSTCMQKGNWLNSTFVALYPATQDQTVNEVMIWLLNHVDAPGFQREVAQAFYLSPSALSERFAKAAGLSYHAYLQRIRLHRAAFLLRNTDWKLYEVCAQMGFRDASYFSRQFRQQMGVSVTEYRKGPGQDWQI
ncbi:MAG: helix-turn-helix domain-containing protein [Clostridiales bacterium]|nr:helix-turn-helix domain-containing protein [Clostridiales bacterium]